MILGQEQLYLTQVEAAAKRFQDKLGRYRFKKGQLQGGSALQMDDRTRVIDWLIRSARQSPVPSESLDQFVQERILRDNDLMGVQFLFAGTSRSASVGRIVIRTPAGATRGYGTGFLIAPGLILTNNHVLPAAGAASPSVIQMNYQIGPAGEQAVPATFRLRPDTLFFTNAPLDFTLCGVSPRGESQEPIEPFGFLRLIEQTGKIVEGNAINIVQHPSGQLKQIAIRANRLIHIFDDFLHYETDTEPGSSGSPLLSDQWELVGLHHAGVPRKNSAGQVVAKDGSPWKQSMGDDQIDWIANEGIRASVIAKAIKAIPGLNSTQKRLRDSIFEATPAAVPLSEDRSTAPSFTADGTITWSFPIEFSIRVPGLAAPPTPAEPPPPPPAPALVPPPIDQRRKDIDAERNAVTRAFKEASGRKYLDKPVDTAAATAYYQGIGASLSPRKRFEALHKLLKTTHAKELAYKPALHLYPWVDLQPDSGNKASAKVRSIYSSKLFSAKSFAEEDLQIELQRLSDAERLIREGGFSAEAVLDSMALEATMPFNCEHVVPQSWFNKRNPMKGDLHHLFACESGCNSFRGNTPYFDFDDFEEALRTACGKREEDRFEPTAGKGEVARATLYFLLRYPGHIAPSRFAESRIQILLAWHADNPVTDHEKHRNAAIFEVQGNRNPLIDRPAWATKIDFKVGLTSNPSDESFSTDQELFEMWVAEAAKP